MLRAARQYQAAEHGSPLQRILAWLGFRGRDAGIARQPWHENAGKTAMVYRLDMIASQNYSSQSIAWNPNNSAMERMKLALFCIGLSSCS